MCIVYFLCCLLVNIAPTSPANRVNPRFSAPNYKINVYGGNLCPITEIRSGRYLRPLWRSFGVNFALLMVMWWGSVRMEVWSWFSVFVQEAVSLFFWASGSFVQGRFKLQDSSVCHDCLGSLAATQSYEGASALLAVAWDWRSRQRIS